MGKQTILIVEDEKAALYVLEKSFCLAGFSVYTAESCFEAFKLIKKNKFDALLLDYYLKNGTAFDICKKVRSDEHFPKIPIVVLSGYSEFISSAYNACQADAFVEKNKPCSEVILVVKSLLRRIEWERGILSNKSDIMPRQTRRCSNGGN